MKRFLDLNTDYKDADFVILPVPYDNTSTLMSGSRFGPRALIEASRGLELYDVQYGKGVSEKICTLPEDELPISPEDMANWVEERIHSVVKDQKFPVVVGGEHTLTLGSVKGLKRHYDRFDVVVFDAHFDLRDTYGGLKLTHATVLRRVSEIAPVFFFGQRVASSEELLYLEEKTGLTRGLEGLKGRDVYVSVDLDVLDPSVCPSVGNPEPGGMLFNELLGVLEKVFRENNVIGFDVVELQPVGNPFYGVYTAAELLKKMIILKQGG